MLNPILADPAAFIIEWYRWGVAIAFAITFITTLWIFFDSQSNDHDATLWRVVSLAAAITVIPSVILSLFPGLAQGLGLLPTLLAFIGPVATLLSLFSLLLYTMGIGVRAYPSEGESLDYDPVPVTSREAGEHTVTLQPGSQQPEPLTPTTSRHAAVPSPLQNDLTQVFAKPESRRRPLAWLVALTGIQIGKTYRLKDIADIGRDSKHNDISLDDRTISRQHARIRWEDGEFVVYDLVSANGVMVNGEKVERQALHHGDRIVMGQIELGFMRVREEEFEPVVDITAETERMDELI